MIKTAALILSLLIVMVAVGSAEACGARKASGSSYKSSCGTSGSKSAAKETGMQMGDPENAETASMEVESPQTHCPVMGEKVNKDIYEDYDGKRVYFSWGY